MALDPPTDLGCSVTYGHLSARLQELSRKACEPPFSNVVFEFYRQRPNMDGAPCGEAPRDEAAAAEEEAAAAADAADVGQGPEPPPEWTRPTHQTGCRTMSGLLGLRAKRSYSDPLTRNPPQPQRMWLSSRVLPVDSTGHLARIGSHVLQQNLWAAPW